jgi:hypothetical protein
MKPSEVVAGVTLLMIAATLCAILLHVTGTIGTI